jgi:hypothetical protein
VAKQTNAVIITTKGAYDIPLFIVFLSKVILLHTTSLLMMTILHEAYIYWKESKQAQKKETTQLS